MDTKIDFNDLRTGGVIKQKQKDYFIIRTRIPGGKLEAKLLAEYQRIAEKYGRGYVHVSTRQSIEIPWIHINDISTVREELTKAGILHGACGPRSRNVVACPGSSVCRFGFINTEEIVPELDKELFGKEVPKKFKTAITGCMNSCAKPQENDLGFVAQGEPECDLEKCTGCTLCAKVCETVCKRGNGSPAIVMDKEGRPRYDKTKCYFEGDCIRVCPVNAWSVKKIGYSVYVGGKIGRFPKLGYKIADFVSGDKLAQIGKKAIEFYNKTARKGQRFREIIDEIGIEEVKKQIL